MRLLKDAEKDPSIFTSHLPSWEVNPGLWRNKGMIASAFIKDPEKAMRDYGAQPSDTVKNILLPIPPINEQLKITQKILDLNSNIESIKANLR